MRIKDKNCMIGNGQDGRVEPKLNSSNEHIKIIICRTTIIRKD